MDKEINLKNFFEAGTQILKEEKPSFNIFEMLGQSSRELTHSAFIAGLLNPKCNHGIGTKFLDLFLERFNIHNFDSASAEVIVEKDCGVEREENGKHLGGRIDIFLQDKSDNIIVIENKIYATDQDYQLERYWNSTDRKATIFYLTLDGHEPSKNSRGNVPMDCYKCISYSEIRQWLADCMDGKECNSDISFVIRHYMNNLDSLISDLELEKLITQSLQNLRFALAVGKQADTIREKIREHFMDWFAEYIKEMLGLTETPNVYSEKKEKIFTVEYESLKLDFCLDHNIYVRLYKPDSEDKDKHWHPYSLKEIFRKEMIGITLNKHWHPYIAQDSPYIAWKYLGINGATINFYEFNHNAYLWLDNEPKFREELGGALKELFAEIKI